MPTAIQLKQTIDLALNDDVLDYSISPTIHATQVKSVVDFVTQEISTAELSLQGLPGLQGVQGIPGTAGEVGPAGLIWKGTFAGGTSYLLNDAVGFEGASYYCILATTSLIVPNLNTTNWALLAAIGATGPQGVQGPAGTEGVGLFKFFRANVSQGGSNDPIVTVFENTFIGDISITRFATGHYAVDFPSTINPHKLFALIGTGSNSPAITRHSIMASSNNGQFGMSIFSYNVGGTPVLQDSLMNKTSIEIRLYN
jgi:hypothetical protein